jgi:hypothetical protein
MDPTLLALILLGAAAVLIAQQTASAAPPAPPDPGLTQPYPLDPFAFDPGSPPLDPSTLDPGTGLPIETQPPVDPQQIQPPDGALPGDPGQVPMYPSPDPGLGAVIPGTPNDFDNQIIYALNQMGITDPLAYARLKAQIAVESGFIPNRVGDYRRAGNPGQYRGYGPGTCTRAGGATVSSDGYCSLGLGQVNRCAHPDLAANYDLMDPNQNILAAAQVWAGCYQAQGGDLDATTRCYNGSGAGTFLYLAQVKTILAQWGVIA